MSLKPVGVATVPDVKQISISSGGNNAIIYKVPAGRMFTGFISNSASTSPTVDNVSLPGSKNDAANEVSLGPGAVVRNSANTTSIVGIERDAV